MTFGFPLDIRHSLPDLEIEEVSITADTSRVSRGYYAPRQTAAYPVVRIGDVLGLGKGE